jgi:3-oxoadipate enol-lactonase
MPTMKVAADLDMHYVIDDFTDPWTKPETLLLLHGFSEAGEAWYAAVPQLARRFRVVRPDMRGFGQSTPMPRDYPWSVDTLIEDFVSLMSGLGADRFHLVGGKVGGTIALCFAARHPQLVRTLSVLGSPVTGGGTVAERIPSWLEHVEKHGVASWARWTMPGRLGSAFPKAGAEWWAQMMGRTASSSHMGFAAAVPSVDARPDLPRIQCPTLVITTEGSDIGSVDDTRAWQRSIPHSRLVALPGDSYHVAATDGERCAREILDFIDSMR